MLHKETVIYGPRRVPTSNYERNRDLIKLLSNTHRGTTDCREQSFPLNEMQLFNA